MIKRFSDGLTNLTSLPNNQPEPQELPQENPNLASQPCI